MANKIQIKRSSVAGKVPTSSDIDVGELAINLTDQKLYSKDVADTVFELGGGGASFEVGEVMLASSAPTIGTWLETGKYYSKAAYPSLATKLGNIADFGNFATVPQAQLPQPYAAPFTYCSATDGSTYVAIGTGGAIRKTTDGVNWVGVPSTTTGTFTALRYLNGRFVAVGASGLIVYSTDGTNWVNASVSSVTTGTVDSFNDVAYGAGVYVIVTAGAVQYSSNLTSWTRVAISGPTFYRVIFANSLFVAVGSSGACYTSPNGITWTSRTAGSTLTDIIYANSLFVATGLSGAIYTSPDGVTWTSRTSGTAQNIQKVVYENSLFVAVGNVGALSTSSDGVSWTLRTTNTTQSLYYPAWNGTNFVAVGTSGTYVTSPDGVTWTPALDASVSTFYNVFVFGGKTIALGATSCVVLAGATRQEVMQSGTWAYAVTNQSAINPRVVAYNGSNLYVAAGSNGTILTSPDGQTWTGQATGLPTNFDKVAYVNGNWIAMGGTGSGANLLTSANGTTWTARTAGTAIFNYAAYGASVYVVVGASGAVYSSPDLVTWTIRSAGAQTFNDVIFANSVFVAVGANNAVYSSTDGVTWTLRTATGTFYRVIYENSLFVAIGGAGVIYTSPDGTTWTARTSNVASPLFDVVWSGSLFVAVGSSGVITSSPDGLTWTARTPGDTGATLNSVSWSGTRFVATITTNGGAFVSTDGITWARSATAYVGSILYSAYLGGKFIAVGAAQIQTSTDGLDWDVCDHVQYVPTALNRTYKYGSMYYALSTTAGIYQSSDGITWSAARTAPVRPFIGMAYSGSAWVAVTGASTGMPTSVYKSTDGTTWTKSADFGTLTSTSTLPTAFVDIEYANGNFIIGCPVTTAQNIVYTIYTSSDGVTWTGRLTPFLVAPVAAIASNGTTAVFGNNTNSGGMFKSTDGGVTWNYFSSVNAAPSASIYANGVWLLGTLCTSTDLDTFANASNVSGFVYSDGIYCSSFNGSVISIKEISAGAFAQINKTSASYFLIVTSTGKAGVTVANKALVPVTRGENFAPNLLAEVQLYSYDTATTFFVPSSSAGGGQTAYIYAGA